MVFNFVSIIVTLFNKHRIYLALELSDSSLSEAGFATLLGNEMLSLS